MDELEDEKVRVIYAETQRGGRTSGRNDERRPSEFIPSSATPFIFIVHQPSIVSSPPLSDSRPAPSVGSEFHRSHTHVGTDCQTESHGVRATAPPEVRTQVRLPAKDTGVRFSLFLLFLTVRGSDKEDFCLRIRI